MRALGMVATLSPLAKGTYSHVSSHPVCGSNPMHS